MNKIRIAHMADMHIGAILKEKSILNEQIENNLIKGLIGIFNAIESMKIQVLLIAGDFYESSNVDLNLLNQVKEIFSRFSGKIILSAGNHDYYSVDSVYNTTWPENTYIFKSEKVDYFEFEDFKLRVYGYSFNSSFVNDRKLREVRNLNGDFINIGVFHGQIDSGDNPYGPISIEDIRNCGLDYLALGHVHQRTEIEKIGQTYFSYSGNPVGRGFDETGQKGLYIGTISKISNDLKFLKIANEQFVIDEVVIDDFSSHENVANQIKEQLQKYDNLKNNYYRLKILGKKKEGQAINISILESFFTDFRYIEFFDETRIEIDYELVRQEETIFGKFVDLVLEEESDFEEIIELGLKAIENKL